MSEATLAAAPPGAGVGVHRWARVAIAAWLLAMTMVIAGVVLLLATRDVVLPAAFGIRGFPTAFAVSYSSIGALVAVRRPENRIGWLLLATGVGAAVLLLASEYPVYAVLAYPGSLPGAEYIAWIASWIWVPLILDAGVWFFLLFPDGRLRSPRWRPLLWLSAGVAAVVTGAIAVAPGLFDNFSYLDNPFPIAATEALRPLGWVLLGLLGACILAASFSLALRLRDARGDERQQLKWVAYAALFVGASAPFSAVRGKPFDILFLVAFSTIPLAAGVAILRYRLYDIDLLINRTLVYGALTAILAGVYTASIGLMQRLFVAFTGERSDAAIVATTLVVVVAFTPIKNRLQSLVDRRFKEPRDPAAVLARFVERLSEGPWVVDPLRARERFAGAAESAFDAAGAALYLGSAGAPAFATPGWTGEVALSVPLGRVGRQDAELRLGPRREDRPYATEDLTILRNAATAVAAAAASHSG